MLDYQLIESRNCSETHNVEAISMNQPIFREWAKIMQCPVTESILLTGSKIRQNASMGNIMYQEFRLLANVCQNNTMAGVICKPRETITEKIESFHMDILTLTTLYALDAKMGYVEQSQVSEPFRVYLSADMATVV